jgi:DNA polymerase I-like protein with 3'-5' exonuclease and polymerase domains
MLTVGTFHPAFILRQNTRLNGVMKADFVKATKLANGWRPQWTDDDLWYDAMPADDVVRVIDSMGGDVTYDVETDGRHPLECDLRCLGLYDGTKGIIIPTLYRSGERHEVEVAHVVDRSTGLTKVKVENRAVWKRRFGDAQEKRIKAALTRLWKRSRPIAQNGQYDRSVLKARWGHDVPMGQDTILLHHVIRPYLPHGLGFLASLYTDIPYYKATDSGDSWAAETDSELYLYCLRDVKSTWQVWKTMEQELKEARLEDAVVYEQDCWQELRCQEWRERGIKVDREALEFFRYKYRTASKKALEHMRLLVKDHLGVGKSEALEELVSFLQGAADAEVVDNDGSIHEVFNPGSLRQLRALLRHLNVPLNDRTATGEISTAKEFLTAARKELISKFPKGDHPGVAFLDYLFAWREASKVNSTYLFPEVLSDGRVHPTFNVHVVPTGRLSSQKPNYQNQPAEIRGMYVPEDDYSLVYGDWDALEMRLGAFMSEDPGFVEAFKQYDARTGPKPHIVNMGNIFGLPKTAEAAEQNPGMYRAAKVFAYAVAYGAGDATVFEQVREELPDMDWPTFQACMKNYKKAYPGLFKFQQGLVDQGTRRGYIDTMVLGRRGYFFEKPDGFSDTSPEASAMQNFPYQGTGADIVGKANRRILDEGGAVIRRLFQLAQVHDELLFEVEDEVADEFKKVFTTLASRSPKGFEHWNLPVEVKKVKRWKPVQARCKCRNQVDVEPVERTAVHVVWGGECKACKEKVTVAVPREVQSSRT